MSTQHASGGGHGHVPVVTWSGARAAGAPDMPSVYAQGARRAPNTIEYRSTQTLSGFPHRSYPAMRLHLWLHSTSSHIPCYPVSYRIVSHTIASHCTAPRLTVPYCPFHRRNAHPRRSPSHRVWGGPFEQSSILRVSSLSPARASRLQTPYCALYARFPRYCG